MHLIAFFTLLNKNEVKHEENSDAQSHPFQLIEMFHQDFLVFAEIITQQGKDGVPDEGTSEGIEEEFLEIHFSQSCRNGNEVPDAGHQPTHKGGGIAVLHKIVFGLLELFPVDEKEFGGFAVGQSVNDGTAQGPGQHVIEGCAQHAADGGEQNDQE